jgi:hypothetical protein
MEQREGREVRFTPAQIIHNVVSDCFIRGGYRYDRDATESLVNEYKGLLDAHHTQAADAVVVALGGGVEPKIISESSLPKLLTLGRSVLAIPIGRMALSLADMLQVQNAENPKNETRIGPLQ